VDLSELLGDHAFQPKTNLALQERKDSIEVAVDNLSRSEGGEDHLFIEAIKGILAKASLVTGSMRRQLSCVVCHQFLEDGAIKQCAHCKRAKYCSRECQIKHWKELGHKERCGKEGHFTKRRDEVENNLQEAAAKVPAQNFHRFCAIASLKGLSVPECVWVVDFTTAPNINLDVLAFDQILSIVPRRDRPDGLQSSLESSCRSGKVPYVLVGRYDAHKILILANMPSPQGSWADMRRLAEQCYPVPIHAARGNPEVCEFHIKQLSNPRADRLL
jgi:MYND finger